MFIIYFSIKLRYNFDKKEVFDKTPKYIFIIEQVDRQT